MSYSDRLEARRRLSASASTLTTPRQESYGELGYNGSSGNSSQRGARRPHHHPGGSPSHRSMSRERRPAHKQVPWNQSVRTGSPVGRRAIDSSALEVSLTHSKNFSRGHSRETPVRRHLTSSLEDGAGGPDGPAFSFRLPHHPRGLNNSRQRYPHEDDEWWSPPHGGRARSTSADVYSPQRYEDALPVDRDGVDGFRYLASDRRAGGSSRAADESRWQSSSPSGKHALGLALSMQTEADHQTELYTRLQDIVVQLSRAAVEQKRTAAHMRKRLEAYAQLVREQDAMISELQDANASAGRENSALVVLRHPGTAFEERQRHGEGNWSLDSLHAPDRSGHQRLTDEELHEWVMRECDRRNSAAPSHRRRSHGDAAAAAGPRRALLQHLQPEVHDVIRSLAELLRDERDRRLEVEEQSSRMIGEQQLALTRAESLLHEHDWGNRRPSRHRRTMAVLEERVDDLSDASVSPPSSSSASPPDSSTRMKTTSAAKAVNASYHRSHYPPLARRNEDHHALSVKPPLPPPHPSPRLRGNPESSSSARGGIAPGTSQYEDAEAILDDIKKRYNL